MTRESRERRPAQREIMAASISPLLAGAGIAVWLVACDTVDPARDRATPASEPALDASTDRSAVRGSEADAAVSRGAGAQRPASDAGAANRPAAEPGVAGRPAADGAAADANRGQDAVPPRPVGPRGCAPQPAGDPLPADRSVQRIETGFRFVEGPVWLDAQGVLLFSDMDFGGSGGLIRRFTPPRTFQVFAEQANSNGLAVGTDGSVIACSQDVRSLSRYDAMTAMRVDLELRYEGQRLNAPNDVVVRSDGVLYFTDPDFGVGASETGIAGVYRLGLDASLTLVTSELDRPNGIAFSPDERTLYVGAATSVMAYPVAEDGSVGTGETLAGFGPADGLAVDCAGNVYVTGDNQVHVFGPDGTAFGEIEVPEETTNAAFGGMAGKTLYITASTSLYAIELDVTGMPY
jgi:gluconolactonase